jgi:hypothetical protein
MMILTDFRMRFGLKIAWKIFFSTSQFVNSITDNGITIQR